MWRDELQAWLLARDSESIAELFSNLKYEGHPGLWHLLLFPLTRIYNFPEAMQFLHIGIAMATVYMIIYYSPFQIVHKVLVSIGYFFIFEYTLIARNYGIGVFLLFCCCTLFQNRNKYPIILSILISLLAHTNVLGLIASICLIMTIICDEIVGKAAYKIQYKLKIQLKGFIAIIICTLGLLTSILQLKPPSDSGFASEWHFNLDFQKLYELTNQIFSAYFPIPTNNIYFWETNALQENLILTNIVYIFLFFLLYLIFTYFLNRRAALILFISMTMGLLSFFYIKYSGGIRHHGYLYIALLASLWIAPYCKQKASKTTHIKERRNTKMQMSIILTNCLTLLFTVHVVGGIIALINDYKYPFSAAKETSEYLKLQDLSNTIVVGHASPSASAIAGYKNELSIYFLDANRYGTFIRWDNKRRRNLPINISKELDKLLLSNNNILLLLNSKLNIRDMNERGIDLIFQSQNATVKNEKYYVYRIHKS